MLLKGGRGLARLGRGVLGGCDRGKVAARDLTRPPRTLNCEGRRLNVTASRSKGDRPSSPAGCAHEPERPMTEAPKRDAPRWTTTFPSETPGTSEAPTPQRG